MGKLLEGEVMLGEEVLLEGYLAVAAFAEGFDEREVLDIGVIVEASLD